MKTSNPAVKAKIFERADDYRVGISLKLLGLMKPLRAEGPDVPENTVLNWAISYTGQYGFEGDPREHVDYFETLEDTSSRWIELVQDYRQRSLLVDRLKAFQKDYLPKLGENYEAVIWAQGDLTATLSSQGPRSRRKRIWVVTIAAPKLDVKGFGIMLVPKEQASGEPEPGAVYVPISRMNEAIRKAWDDMVKTYLDTR